jgi:hypothetical protein
MDNMHGPEVRDLTLAEVNELTWLDETARAYVATAVTRAQTPEVEYLALYEGSRIIVTAGIDYSKAPGAGNSPHALTRARGVGER